MARHRGSEPPERELDELLEQLETVRLGDPQSLGTLTAKLAEMWGAQTVSYRPTLSGPAWDLEFVHTAGPIAAGPMRRAFREYLAGAPVTWSYYNALRPQPEQRNAVWGDREMLPPDRALESVHIIRHLYTRVGLFGLSQLRTLVCDGPVLLAWVGGFREQPFSRVERTMLGKLIQPLQRRLKVERLLADHGSGSAGLVAALDAIASPALVVQETGRVQHANAAALELLERDGLSFAARVRDAVLEPPRDGSIAITPIAEDGAPRQFLVVLRGGSTLGARLELFKERWKLTPRQSDVLALLVRGDSNKSIAEKLAVAEVTVELHVTALLRKAGVENRASLVGRFWTEG